MAKTGTKPKKSKTLDGVFRRGPYPLAPLPSTADVVPTVKAGPAFSGKRIREIRLALGLTQVEASARVLVNQITWSHWERGTRKPDGPSRKLLEQLEREAFPPEKKNGVPR